MENKEKIVELFSMICTQFDGAPLGKKVTQKLFYFFERKGIKLNLKYGIHFYGPYSSKLDTAIHVLESDDYLTIDTSGMTHIISMKNNYNDKNALSPDERTIANSVITLFAHKSPLELEALATMDYVANVMLDQPNKIKIINSFKTIKGNKFSDEMIDSAFSELEKDKLILLH